MSKAYGEAMGHYYYDTRGLSTIAIRIGFTLSNDVPTFDGSALSLWLSHRDTAQIHVRAIDAPAEVGYTVVFATSDNYWKIFSLDKARAVLGYQPQDDAGPVLDLTKAELKAARARLHRVQGALGVGMRATKREAAARAGPVDPRSSSSQRPRLSCHRRNGRDLPGTCEGVPAKRPDRSLQISRIEQKMRG